MLRAVLNDTPFWPRERWVAINHLNLSRHLTARRQHARKMLHLLSFASFAKEAAHSDTSYCTHASESHGSQGEIQIDGVRWKC